MGQVHLICVRDDGLRLRPPADLPAQVGDAVVLMCTTTQVYFPADRDTPGKVVAIGGMANCIEHVDYINSSETRGYLWTGNCLRPFHQLPDADLEVVLELLTHELRRRRERGA